MDTTIQHVKGNDEPILKHMLQGLEVEVNPVEKHYHEYH